MTIDQAIDRSRTHTEIVTCRGTQDEIEQACAQAEGSCDLLAQYGYVDVWGTTDDGAEYRLHIERA